MLPSSLYAYVWNTSRHEQVKIGLLIAVVAPLSAAPLELQRQIVDHAINDRSILELGTLGLIYLFVALVQGGLKYVLNLMKGRTFEIVTRDLRRRIVQKVFRHDHAAGDRERPAMDTGTTVSMLAAESEEIGGFASESISVPLLQIGTMLWVLGYLIWVEPLIAALAIVVYVPQAFMVPYIQRSINILARRRTRLVRKLGRDVATGLDSPLANRDGPHGRIRTLIDEIFGVRIRIYRYKYFLTFFGNFLDALGPIIVLVFGGYLVIQGQTDIGTLVVVISGFQKISGPWDELINFYRTISNTRVTYGLAVTALSESDQPMGAQHAVPS